MTKLEEAHADLVRARNKYYATREIGGYEDKVLAELAKAQAAYNLLKYGEAKK